MMKIAFALAFALVIGLATAGFNRSQATVNTVPAQALTLVQESGTTVAQNDVQDLRRHHGHHGHHHGHHGHHGRLIFG